MEKPRKTDSFRGSWTGQLIDIGGFEGQITLTLRGNEGTVDGLFDALIEGQHRPTRMHGVVTGRLANRKFLLRLDSNPKESAASVQFEGALFETRRGVPALCGRYLVSARQSSALLGGVMCARQPVPMDKDENVSVRSASPMTRGGATLQRVERAPAKKRAAKKSRVQRGPIRKAASRSAS